MISTIACSNASSRSSRSAARKSRRASSIASSINAATPKSASTRARGRSRSIDAMAPVMTRLDATDGAARAGVVQEERDEERDDIAGIYVVGGASELPLVARALRQRFGRRVHRSPYPSAAIAIGLAIACDE